jgi:hypothetical protein
MRSCGTKLEAVSVTAVLLGLLLVPGLALGQNARISDQKLDAAGEGYTVITVWGSHYDMGYAQGKVLAQEIVSGVQEVKQLTQTVYATLRLGVQAAVFKPAELEQEMEGMVAGVKAAEPTADIDVLDLKVVNTYGDWSYGMACRSHSAWGGFVGGATKTLSTRRLDFGVPAGMKAVRHHVLIARAPSGGSVRWVNLAWPGYVLSVTGVNEYGTLASLHDYQTKMVVGPYMPRTVAVRYALTAVQGLPLEQHLDRVFADLQAQPVMTGTFLNYYVPEGKGGVLTCPAGQPCSKKRTPQADYFDGTVLITTNAETDGHTVPGGGDFMDTYYQAGGPKTIADHYGLMGHTGMHLLSLDYRGRGDMTLWAEGRLSTGVTPTIKVEWTQLYAGTTGLDGGSGAKDAASGAKDAAIRTESGAASPEAGSGGDGGAKPKDSGCSCTLGAGSWTERGLLAVLLLLGAVLLGAAVRTRGKRRGQRRP